MPILTRCSSALIGIFHRAKGGNLNVFPVAVSIWVTLMSAVSILGTPLQIYLFGLSFYLLAFSFLLSVPIVAHVFVPFFHKLQLPSIYELSEHPWNVNRGSTGGPCTHQAQLKNGMSAILAKKLFGE
ncbi:hypothetical protein ACOMHN_017492 [Nucella lapillus]